METPGDRRILACERRRCFVRTRAGTRVVGLAAAAAAATATSATPFDPAAPPGLLRVLVAAPRFPAQYCAALGRGRRRNRRPPWPLKQARRGVRRRGGRKLALDGRRFEGVGLGRETGSRGACVAAAFLTAAFITAAFITHASPTPAPSPTPAQPCALASTLAALLRLRGGDRILALGAVRGLGREHRRRLPPGRAHPHYGAGS